MTQSEPHEPGQGGDDLFAAEYVLGVLSAGERRQAAARIEAEPAFARLVDEWEMRLAPLGEGFEPVDPPAHLKDALDRRLFGAGMQAAARPGLWQSLAFWRGATAVALAAALALLVLPLLFTPIPEPTEPAQRLVAAIAPSDSDVQYLAVYDADHDRVALSHISGEAPAGSDFELWLIEGDAAPVSVGLVPSGAAVEVPVAEALRASLAAGAVFAISQEPEGGSPTGLPTGPVVAAGDLRTI